MENSLWKIHDARLNVEPLNFTGKSRITGIM
jgi:hypothetical protein